MQRHDFINYTGFQCKTGSKRYIRLSQGTTVRLRSRDDDMCNALKKSECVDFRERIAGAEVGLPCSALRWRTGPL